MPPTILRQAPATPSDLQEGMHVLPGSELDGFSPFPILPEFGMQLFTDWHAQHSPQHPIAKYVRDDDFAHAAEKTVVIDASEWGTLVRKAGSYILEHLRLTEQQTFAADAKEKLWRKGPGGELMPPVLAIIAHADVMSYRLLDLGAQRAGLVSCFISPSLGAEAMAHLLRLLDPVGVLVGPEGNMPELHVKVEEALQTIASPTSSTAPALHPIKVPWICATDLGERMQEIDGTSIAPPPFAPEQPQFIIHSSGTTSKYPKLVIHRQRMMLAALQMKHYALPASVTHQKHIRSGIPTNSVAYLPPDHTICPSWTYAGGGMAEITAFFQPRNGPPGPQPQPNAPPPASPIERIVDSLIAHGSTLPVVSPMFCLELLRPASANALRKLKANDLTDLRFGGGMLMPDVAERLEKEHGFRLWSGYGSTETICLTCWTLPDESQLLPESQSVPIRWDHTIGPIQPEVHYRPIPNSEYHDLLIACRRDGAQAYQPSVLNDTLPDGRRAYVMGDAVEILPPLCFAGGIEYPRFRIVGRVDDRIDLSNGRKVNPTPVLDAVQLCPHVEAVVMFGFARPCTGLLIQPVAGRAVEQGDDKARGEFLQAVWPFVERANKEMPTYGAVTKEIIVIASKQRPFARTGKGSVRTGVTLDEYAREIEACYEAQAA